MVNYLFRTCRELPLRLIDASEKTPRHRHQPDIRNTCTAGAEENAIQRAFDAQAERTAGAEMQPPRRSPGPPGRRSRQPSGRKRPRSRLTPDAPLHILMVTPEAHPFAKTGGLAEVSGALPLALARLGHRVTLVVPRYRGTCTDGATVSRRSFRSAATR